MRELLIGVSLCTSTVSYALDVREIELRRLFEPTPAELRGEASGDVYIYDGLKDSDVARAMTEEFDRVDSMMFIRVKKTDEQGDVRKNPETGADWMQDDGC